jgi:hypothetical protein
MFVLHAVIEFTIAGTVSLLDIHQIVTVYENDCTDVGTVQYWAEYACSGARRI